MSYRFDKIAARESGERNIPGQFYLGKRPGYERTDDSTDLPAHAWLQSGDAIVNGAAANKAFRVLCTFCWDAKRD